MRELKFRGQDLYGNWLHGWLIKQNGFFFIQNNVGGNDAVMENTVGQYTGLLDSKEAPIYEGDILKYHFEDDTHDYMPVSFKDGSFMTGIKDAEYLFGDLDPKHGFRIEVAGNIHEHPHLLQP